MFAHKHTCPNTPVYSGNRTIHEVLSWPLWRTEVTTLLLHYSIEWRWGYKLFLTPEPSITFQMLMVERKWTEVFMLYYEMRTFSSEDRVFDRMHGIYLVDFPQLEQWICLLMRPAICSRPKRQIFLFEKKKLKKMLVWKIRPSKEDTKCRLLCGDSEMNEFFWMLSNCSEFWDYRKPRQLHSRDKCVRSLNSKRNLPTSII